MTKAAGLLISLMILWCPAVWADPGAPTGAPAALTEWRDWVLQGYEDRFYCPPGPSGAPPRCVWPVSLSLSLGEHGGYFTAEFELKTERAMPLPGGPGAWPGAVTDATGRAVPVLGRDRPQVWLPAGRHRLTGLFEWPNLPETILVPLGFVLSIEVEGQPLSFPPMDLDYQSGQARVWLKEKSSEPALDASAAPETDFITVNVNRLIQDSQPMMIKSRFRLMVSGREREILLDRVLLPETRVTYLSSPLPAQLTAEGLRVRVKPGVYELFLDSRSLNRSEALGPVPESAPEPEYWIFQAHPQLRLVEISGAEQIDPSQADVYGPWRQDLPIYLVQPGQGLTFTTIRRGDPEPPPDQLNLARECWLDYDGQGLSCRDHLTGALNRQWHLNTSPPFSLSQATLGGQGQVITWQTDSQGQPAPGLQLREGQIDLQADLRLDNFAGLLPASGWDHPLETEGQKLNLPPGYRLGHVSGADARQSSLYSGAGTWTGAWGTLDFFIILIITIAVWKLYGRPQGLLALLALILTYHEPLAPRMVFLHLLACAALLKTLPLRSRARWLARAWRLGAALTLVILTTLFLVSQARVTLYPQLENPRTWHSSQILDWDLPVMGGGAVQTAAVPMEYYAAEPEMEEALSRPMPAPAARASSSKSDLMRSGYIDQAKLSPESPKPAQGQTGQEDYANQMVRLKQAPDAKVQNNAPRPEWQWRSVKLYYNGTVAADQTVRLYLITPGLSRMLGVLRIGLMLGFVLVILELGLFQKLRTDRQEEPFPMNGPAAALGLALMAALLLTGPAPALAQSGFPDQNLLNEYRSRLLERKPVPEPGVAELTLTAGAENLKLDFLAEIEREAILILPTLDRDIFQPTRVSLNGQTDLPLMEEGGRWLALLPSGRHHLLVEGRLKKPGASFQSFQISFPPETRPQKTRIAPDSAWKVEGLENDGRLVGGALFLTRLSPSEAVDEDQAGADSVAGQTLEPFFHVQRTISLGLEWQVHTTVRRVTPTGAPVSLQLPLLTGETPLSAHLRLDGGRVTLNFGPQESQVSWDSSLKTASEIDLTAIDGPWTETWSLDVSPIWRVTHQGLTPINSISGGFWQPTWRPWPGEQLTLTVDRPQPVPGQYAVIDRGQLSVTVGENQRSGSLGFRLRTSQGGPFNFSLPPGAEVREFKVDGRAVPLSASAEEANGAPSLTASLSPGNHNLEAAWTEPRPLGARETTPALDLGLPTANMSINLTLPENRWILWIWGPLEGPAVQFWPLLAVLLLAAVILGRVKLTPLGWGSWFLLGLGLIQLHLAAALIVVGWLLFLGLRRTRAPSGVFRFNAAQVGLAIWTLLALILIYLGIKSGLLQNPDMLIAGGGSYGQRLAWFTDRAQGVWPEAGVLSVSVWYYKALMLAWSLWLAVSLIKWLKWGWNAFSSQALWKVRPSKPVKKEEGI